MGLLEKKKGMFARTRMFVLTEVRKSKFRVGEQIHMRIRQGDRSDTKTACEICENEQGEMA